MTASLNLDPLETAVLCALLAGDPEQLRLSFETLARHRAHTVWRRQLELPREPTVVLVGDRQTGKTTAAAEWVKEGRALGEKRRLVVLTLEQGREVRYAHDLTEEEIVSVRQLRNGKHEPGARYFVDEVQLLVAEYLQLPGGAAGLVVCTGA